MSEFHADMPLEEIIWKFKDDKFDELMKQLSESYYDMERSCRAAREQVREWNKDEEIQKLKNEIAHYRKHSLLQLTDKSKEKLDAFTLKHIHSHTFIYQITGTGIGSIVKVSCDKCGEEIDITDAESW